MKNGNKQNEDEGNVRIEDTEELEASYKSLISRSFGIRQLLF